MVFLVSILMRMSIRTRPPTPRRRRPAAGLVLLATLMPLAAAAMPIERALDPDAGAVAISEVVGVRPVTSSGAAEQPEAATPPAPTVADELQAAAETVDVEDWQRLADCESGRWDADGDPEPGSARWAYGLTFDHGDTFQGGLNFHPETWDAFRDKDMPDHAGRASKLEEIVVGERVLDAQGWGAWPVCSEKLDLPE